MNNIKKFFNHQTVISIYLVILTLCSVFSLLDVYLEQFKILYLFFEGIDIKVFVSLKVVIYIFFGGFLGGIFSSFLGIYTYGAVKKEFEDSYALIYYIGPLMAGILGIATYALIESGLSLFTGEVNDMSKTSINQFAYFGVGFLVGLSWKRVATKMDNVAKKMFNSDQNANIEQ